MFQDACKFMKIVVLNLLKSVMLRTPVFNSILHSASEMSYSVFLRFVYQFFYQLYLQYYLKK